MEIDGLVKRSKESYGRIKRTVRARDAEHLHFKHKESVERISQVIEVVSSVEQGSAELRQRGRTVADYESLLEVLGVLKAHASIEAVGALAEKVRKRAEHLERHLDQKWMQKLKECLEQGGGGWAHDLVSKKRKGGKFIEVVHSHITKVVVGKVLGEGAGVSVPLAMRVRELASEGFEGKEVSAISEVVKDLLRNEVEKEVKTRCYAGLKSNGAIQGRIEAVLSVARNFMENMPVFMGSTENSKNISDLLKSTIKALFIELETAFSSASADESSLWDPMLESVLSVVLQIDHYPKIFDKWSHKRQPLLRMLFAASREKSARINGSIGRKIFLINALHVLRKMGLKDTPDPKDLAGDLLASMKNELLAQTDATNRERGLQSKEAVNFQVHSQPLALLLGYVEAFSEKAASYRLPSRYRREVVPEYKAMVIALGEELGGFKEASKSHVTSLIDDMFKGNK